MKAGGLLLLSAFAASSALAQPKDIADGVDPSHLTPACEAGYRYGRTFNAFDAAGLGSLFAEDADYIGPDGKAQHGPEQISARYATVLSAYRKTIPEGVVATRVVQFFPRNQDECLVEFEAWVATAGGYQLFAVDHFFVDGGGKIAKFIPYIQTRAISQLAAHLAGAQK